jgi:hypothetical protein
MVRIESGKIPRSDGRNHAVDVGDAGAEADQGEHVGAAVDEGRPEALEEWEAAVEDDGGGERELKPRQIQAPAADPHDEDEVLENVRPEHAAHGECEERSGENDADPEATGHVAEFGIGLFRGGGYRARFEGHAADGA